MSNNQCISSSSLATRAQPIQSPVTSRPPALHVGSEDDRLPWVGSMLFTMYSTGINYRGPAATWNLHSGLQKALWTSAKSPAMFGFTRCVSTKAPCPPVRCAPTALTGSPPPVPGQTPCWTGCCCCRQQDRQTSPPDRRSQARGPPAAADGAPGCGPARPRGRPPGQLHRPRQPPRRRGPRRCFADRIPRPWGAPSSAPEPPPRATASPRDCRQVSTLPSPCPSQAPSAAPWSSWHSPAPS
mmetsp:Transcript_3223/g.9159  ORF Transcript_3223/g.9159 Transcript_3223/m.9159 type:complete len:241 (-) Transcript_3223:1946-2668(-)